MGDIDAASLIALAALAFLLPVAVLVAIVLVARWASARTRSPSDRAVGAQPPRDEAKP